MNKVFFFSVFLLLSGTASLSAQSNEEEQVKRFLQGRINEIFHRWDDEWSVDKYIDETAVISYFKESDYSTNTIIAHGTFTVKRTLIFSSNLNVKFTCKIRANSDGSTTLVNLCYQDSSVDQKDCCEPSKWGLHRL
jgi:hypothetical protein